MDNEAVFREALKKEDMRIISLTALPGISGIARRGKSIAGAQYRLGNSATYGCQIKLGAKIAVFAWSLWVVFVLKYDALLERAPGLGLKALSPWRRDFRDIKRRPPLAGRAGYLSRSGARGGNRYSGKDRKAREKTSSQRNKLILPIFYLIAFVIDFALKRIILLP